LDWHVIHVIGLEIITQVSMVNTKTGLLSQPDSCKLMLSPGL